MELIVKEEQTTKYYSEAQTQEKYAFGKVGYVYGVILITCNVNQLDPYITVQYSRQIKKLNL